MHMLGEQSHVEVGSRPPNNLEHKQRRRMQIALGLLVLALMVVLYRDWQLYPSATDNQQDASDASTTHTSITVQPAPPILKSSVPVHKPKPHEALPPAPKDEAGPVVTASNRTVLPPLEVEVVAGDQRRRVPTVNPSIKLDMQSGDMQKSGSAAAADSAVSSRTPAKPSTGNVDVSAEAAKVISRPVQPEYPILARQMKVQGSVVLQALIDRAGKIEDLHVVSGPAMLSAAARQAVAQWTFKPYFVAGVPVETETRITVNFTISTN